MSTFLQASRLKEFAESLEKLAEQGPDRLTLTQTSFFLRAATADLVGKPATFSELRDQMGGSIGRSLHTTYKVFVDEGRNRGDKREPGLGWLTREVDSADNRRKFLRLTATGRGILLQAFDREGL